MDDMDSRINSLKNQAEDIKIKLNELNNKKSQLKPEAANLLDVQSDKCSICLEHLSPYQNYAKPGNPHDMDAKYHVNCLDNWFKTSNNRGVTSSEKETFYLVFNGDIPVRTVDVGQRGVTDRPLLDERLFVVAEDIPVNFRIRARDFESLTEDSEIVRLTDSEIVRLTVSTSNRTRTDDSGQDGTTSRLSIQNNAVRVYDGDNVGTTPDEEEFGILIKSLLAFVILVVIFGFVMLVVIIVLAAIS